MLKRFTVMVVAVVALLGPSFALAQSEEPTVATSDTPELGTFLTDAEGRTLYMFTRDEPGTSNCTGECLANWPAFVAEEPLTLPDGVPGELTQITREDGTQQVAYNDIPLYYYSGDTAAGDTNGQGIGDVWFVVTPAPAGFQIATPIGSPGRLSRSLANGNARGVGPSPHTFGQPHRVPAPGAASSEGNGWIGVLRSIRFAFADTSEGIAAPANPPCATCPIA